MMRNDMLDWLYQRALMRRKSLDVYSKHVTTQPRVSSVADVEVKWFFVPAADGLYITSL